MTLCIRTSHHASDFLTCRMMKPCMLQISDLCISGELMGAADPAATLTKKILDCRPMTTCSPAYAKHSMNLGCRIIDRFRSKDKRSCSSSGYRRNGRHRQHDASPKMRTRGYRLFCLHGKGSWTRMRVIMMIASSGTCVKALYEGSEDG
jgi:hypothetical protein